MNNMPKLVKGFLKSKGIEWSGDIIRYSNGEGSFYTAEDGDFDGMTIQNVILQRNKSRAELAILATKTHFIVFDKRRTRFESDFSQEWQNYLVQAVETEQRRTEAVRGGARQDMHIAVIKGDADCMSTKIKKAIFDNEELDAAVKAAIAKSADEEENENI